MGDADEPCERAKLRAEFSRALNSLIMTWINERKRQTEQGAAAYATAREVERMRALRDQRYRERYGMTPGEIRDMYPGRPFMEAVRAAAASRPTPPGDGAATPGGWGSS